MRKLPFAACCVVLASLAPASALAGDVENTHVILHRLTTPIEVHFEEGPPNFGSGFFFRVLAPRDPDVTGSQSRKIAGLYVVTNKHVVRLDRFDRLQKLVFYVRLSDQGRGELLPVEISQNELGQRIHPHPKGDVDVVAIDVLDLLESELSKRATDSRAHEEYADLLTWSAVSRENFPEVSRLGVGAGEDVIVIGYPRGLFDSYNKLPILKRGMLSTTWGSGYENLDAFLVDYRGFPGSSGSLVISKPTHLLFDGGRWYYSEAKGFLFLGVYSGELYRKSSEKKAEEAFSADKARSDLGLVWYYYTIEEAVGAAPFRSRGLAALGGDCSASRN